MRVFFGDCVSPLIGTIKQCNLKISARGDLSKQTLDYFFVENLKNWPVIFVTQKSQEAFVMFLGDQLFRTQNPQEAF